MSGFDFSPLYISVSAACVAALVSFFLGIWLAQRLLRVGAAWRAWLDGALTLPLVLPPTVVGYILLLIFGRRSPVGMMMEKVGCMVVFSWPATVIAATVVAFPMMYRASLGAFEQLNPTLLQAAETLGATRRRIFWRIMLPLAAPGVLAGAVLTFARALGEFGATLMLAGNIPGRTQTMPIAIFAAVDAGDDRTALLWMGVLVLLSLCMVRLMHLSLRPRRGDGGDATMHAAPIPLQTAPHASPRAGARLSMIAEKKLANFTLRIQLQGGDGALGLLGASGSGKTMTLRMIAGIVRPDSGRIELNGRTLFDSEKRIDLPASQRGVGVVFQDYALFPHLTVERNIAFGLHRLDRRERQRRVRQLLEQMRIVELAALYPEQLSGGQKQRVAIARALATTPDALLLDEPFAALDPHLRRRMEEQMRETLRSYQGAVLIVTHDMEEAFRFCTDLLALERGEVIARGPRQQLFDAPPNAATAQLTGCKNIVKAAPLDRRRLRVEAWDCVLETSTEAPTDVNCVGYRSHQFRFQEQCRGANVFPCWLVEASAAPHEMTLYLHLHGRPAEGALPHLQADVSNDLWRELREAPQPWRIQIAPERILLLKNQPLAARNGRRLSDDGS